MRKYNNYFDIFQLKLKLTLRYQNTNAQALKQSIFIICQNIRFKKLYSNQNLFPIKSNFIPQLSYYLNKMINPVEHVQQKEQVQEEEGPNPDMIRIHIQCELSFGEMKIEQPVSLHTPFKFLADHLKQLLSNQYNQTCEYLYTINGKSIKSNETKELVELGVKNGDSLVMKKKQQSMDKLQIWIFQLDQSIKLSIQF
ncbi:hypothetical protein pb186bvf_003188 [Paramecium bursaria]